MDLEQLISECLAAYPLPEVEVPDYGLRVPPPEPVGSWAVLLFELLSGNGATPAATESVSR